MTSQVGLLRDPWNAFDKLLQQLGATVSTSQSVTAAVEAARIAVGGDVAFWYSRTGTKVLSYTGAPTLPTDRSIAIVQQLFTRIPPDAESLLWTNPHPGRDPLPEAAIITCDSRTQGCIVVLSFDPTRRFTNDDVHAVRMTLKILLAQRAQSHASIKELLNNLLHCLTTIIDSKDPYTAGHSERVARMGIVLARQMGLPQLESDIFLAGLLHDVGKIGLRDELLQRPGKLTPDEWEEMKRHPVIGEQIVASIRPFDRLRPAVRHHHEHYNGRGYPDGLSAGDIPILARILAVADACDAMMMPRRYRPAKSPQQIDAIFNAEAGRQFDPSIVRAFMSIRHEIYPPIYQKGIGESAYHAINAMVENMTEQSVLKMPTLE